MKKNMTALFLCILAISAVLALAIAAAVSGEGALHDTGVGVRASSTRDVAVTAVTVPDAPPAVGSTHTITVSVKNEGRSPVLNVPVALAVNGVVGTRTATITRINAGATSTQSFSYTFPSTAGVYTVTGTAGPMSGETDLMDNALSILVMTEGAVKTATIENGAVTTAKIADGTIEDEDLGDNAIPKIGYANTTAVEGLTNTTTEIDNGSIITERNTTFFITYTANCTNTTTDNAVLINVTIDGGYAAPGEVSIADSWSVNLARTITFLNTSVPAGTHSVNVTAKTRVSDGTYTNLTDRVFTVIAIPTA